MPELTVDAGVTIDLASRDDFERHHQWMKDRLGEVRKAYYRVLSANLPLALITNPGPAFIDVGQPPAGHLYSIQWACVFGDTPFAITAISNVFGALCIGVPGGSRAVGTFPITDVVSPSVAVPSLIQVPDQVICHGGQHIYLMLQGTGLTAGVTQGYNLNVGVLSATDEPRTLGWVS